MLNDVNNFTVNKEFSTSKFVIPSVKFACNNGRKSASAGMPADLTFLAYYTKTAKEELGGVLYLGESPLPRVTFTLTDGRVVSGVDTGWHIRFTTDSQRAYAGEKKNSIKVMNMFRQDLIPIVKMASYLDYAYNMGSSAPEPIHLATAVEFGDYKGPFCGEFKCNLDESLMTDGFTLSILGSDIASDADRALITFINENHEGEMIVLGIYSSGHNRRVG